MNIKLQVQKWANWLGHSGSANLISICFLKKLCVFNQFKNSINPYKSKGPGRYIQNIFLMEKKKTENFANMRLFQICDLCNYVTFFYKYVVIYLQNLQSFFFPFEKNQFECTYRIHWTSLVGGGGLKEFDKKFVPNVRKHFSRNRTWRGWSTLVLNIWYLIAAVLKVLH